MVALAPTNGTGWTDKERGEIDRLELLCRGNEHWELECDHTEEGDPWCIIYDRQEHRIVLHVARIERRYVVVWPSLKRSMKTATINAAVDIAMSEIARLGDGAGWARACAWPPLGGRSSIETD